ncbi:hypothetical protein [Streptomyces galbus]|uniref:Uncharacterized protein n=1 Tax=Streptomyces galbus TaxID=33898 RepID=A0A4V6AXH4_STRGB|nr:hypothetical protein [Streptomyces galbus]TKT07753.1 hypothetical protein E4U92_20070 [Streptomyces galbus]GHD40797.1 hypothetical protein GCM10010335_42040 [Streptomyces galbus]
MPSLIERVAGPRRAGTRAFHETERGLEGVNGPDVPPHNETGVIGWGTSWRMQGYLLMARHTGRPGYAERLAELIDQVLRARDDVRGVRDFRGRSLPVWSSAHKFTAASAVLCDTDGRPALHLTVCPPHARTAKVTVAADGDRHFRVTVTGPGRADVEVTGLSLDPLDERRADRVLYAAYEQRTAVTARLVPADRPASGPRRPRPGVFALRPAMVPLAAQTGMITYPMAGLARLARERPGAVPTSVRRRVDGYLDAVDRALRVHDEQWGTTDDGRGFYRWLPDEPVSFAGAELPTNEFLAMGRTAVQLAVVTGEDRWRERAAATARALRGDLTVTDGAASWPYWPGFGRVYRGWQATGDPKTDGSDVRPSYRPVTVPEDVTHALIDLDFLCLYHDAPGLPEVFTRADMRAVANTFTRHAVQRGGRGPRLRHDVGGRGRRGTDREQVYVTAWLPLRRWSREVPRLVRAVRPPAPPAPLMGVDSYCAALLAA